ncbi:MAG: RNA binding S1 domain protein, partial [Berkelbacteria bacterium GW2011_GWA2_38_9]
LRRADQERLNDDLKAKFQEGKTVDVIVKEANKGGLLIDIGDYQGFLPVSQLASRHYPKVDGGDPDKIFSRLKDLMGETLEVKIINFDSNAKKLIFSEKAAGDREQEEKLSQIKEGETVEGTVTGIVDFGIFVKIGEGKSEIEGLVHISEIAWGRVTNLTELYKVGDKIKVLIVSTDENRVSLSVKRLQNDPWRTAAKKYKISDTMNGEVTKITDYGLFVRIDNEIDGLVHLSEMMAEKAEKIEDISEKFEIGKKYNFRIISFDPDAHRLGLSLKSEDDDSKDKKKIAITEDKKEKKVSKTVAKTKTTVKKKEVSTEKTKPKTEEVL